MKCKTQYKAKDYEHITLSDFASLHSDLQAELVSHYYLYKRRRLNKKVLYSYLNNLTPEKIKSVISYLDADENIKKFFRSMRNINPKILNEFFHACPVKRLRILLFLIKLEDRRKVEPSLFLKCSLKELVYLINDHFATFGKLPLSFFKKELLSLDAESLQYILQEINPEFLQELLKRSGMAKVKKFASALKFIQVETVLENLKGVITLSVVKGNKRFLVRVGRKNKRNILETNALLFQNMELLHIELTLCLYEIKLKQRKHIEPIIAPLFHDLKLIEYCGNLIPRSIRNIAMFLSKNNLRDASYAYHYICKTKLEGLKKITASRYTKDTQALFDDFYQQFSSQHLKQESGDKKRKNDLQKLVACRCIEYYLEHDPKPKIPVLLPFDVRMDSDGRILLGYSRVQGKNSEIRPTLKHFSNCFVRFRPHIDGAYDAYKINDHGKIIDFVPALFLMAKSRLQHVAPGYAVAEYIKGYRPRPLSFRTYLTADSKIYFAKIDGEVIQTLTSYLSGGNAVECSIRKDEIGYFMDVYPIEPSTAKKILKKPVRSIMLRNEKPYFTDIADDFAPARFFEMPKNIFNSAIPLFKQRYFCAFYDGLTLEQKKELYEKLTSKGEEYLIEQIGHEKFADDLEQITFTYGDELANISELLGDKEEVEQREYVASYSRRETDIRGDEPEFADVDDDSFFARSEAERIDEFGFDFAAYPPELTFQIKMPILRKIFESFPREFRRYIKIHADDIDEEIQDKLVSINPRLLDGIPIERTFKVRKDPVKRAFIDELIRILEDKVSYDAINVIINYLRNATVRIRKNDRTGAFIVKKFVMSQVAELVSSESDLLYSAIELEIID